MTTIYNVHIYREMRLVYGGIEANSHEEAAAIARDKPTDEADSIDDCDGETFAALVDVQGDEEYEQSRDIAFEGERERKAASRMLAALTWLLDDLADAGEDRNPETGEAYDSVAFARAAKAAAEPVVPRSEQALAAGYFVGASGARYAYSDIADRIRSEAPHTLGKHIFVQLEAIGLLEEMQDGATPCGLPFTFAETAGVAAAKHTPGPWAYEEETGRIYRADGDVEPTIAFVELDNTPPEQAKADGHLLAASLKLREALREAQATIAALRADVDAFRQQFGNYHGYDASEASFNTEQCSKKIYAAIAEAKGEAPRKPLGSSDNQPPTERTRTMTKFNIQHVTDRPDRVFVAIDDRLDVAIIRTADGLKVEVYPIADGEIWVDPYDRFEVDEGQIRELERELRDA